MSNTERVGGATIYRISQERLFDDRGITAVREELFQLLEGVEKPKLAINFAQVEAASSRFFGVLVGLRKRIRAAKGEIVLFGLNSTLNRLIEVTKMSKLFLVCETEDAALEALLKKR